jgi:hypothetical protein
MTNFDDFYGILSLNSLKWKSNEYEDEDLVEKKHHNLIQQKNTLETKESNHYNYTCLYSRSFKQHSETDSGFDPIQTSE